MEHYRNPNEAIQFLRKVKSAMDALINYNVVSIETASVRTSKVTVVNLDSLGDSKSGSGVSHKPRSSIKKITRSTDTVGIPRIPKMPSGEFQSLVRTSKEYRQTRALLVDLKSKAVEWQVMWENNPHMGKLMAELEDTNARIREALLSLRRKINASAKKYCPVKILNTITEIESHIETLPAKKIIRNNEIVFPNDEDPNTIHYKFSFKISQLKTHSTRVIKTYLIVITYVLDVAKSTAVGYLSTMMEADPDSDLGGSFYNAAGAIDLLNTYMDLDKIDVDVGTLPFPEIPSLVKENIGVDTVDSLDLDKDTDRLYVRTTKFLDDDEQEELLHHVLRHIPGHLKHGQLRIDVGVEAAVEIAPIADRHARADLIREVQEAFDTVYMRNVGASPTSPIEFYTKTISFKSSNQILPELKRFLIKRATVKNAVVRNVFSFAVGAGKRSDVRALRRFIDSISDELPKESVLKVRKALGV